MVKSIGSVSDSPEERSLRRRVTYLEGRLAKMSELEARVAALEAKAEPRRTVDVRTPRHMDTWRDQWLADPDKTEARARQIVADPVDQRAGQLAATFLSSLEGHKLDLEGNVY